MPPTEPIFSERATHVSIVDEAAGEFIEIQQDNGHGREGRQAIGVSDEGEWAAIKSAVDRLFEEISSNVEVTRGADNNRSKGNQS